MNSDGGKSRYLRTIILNVAHWAQTQETVSLRLHWSVPWEIVSVRVSLFPQSMTDSSETEPLIMKPGVEGSVQEVVVNDKVPTASLRPHQRNRLPQGSSSLFGAAFIVVNASLGAGLLAFPFAFYSAGGAAPSMAVMVVSGHHVTHSWSP